MASDLSQVEATRLQSRIDEQAQLICALKRRADQSLERCRALEALNEEREAMREAAEAAREVEERRARQLEERFEDLATNHQMMIRFKDEYKQRSADLRRECCRLQQELDSGISHERDDLLKRLQEEVKARGRVLQERDELLEQLKEATKARETALQEREESTKKLEEELRRLSIEAEEQRTRSGELEERRRRETEELRGQLERQRGQTEMLRDQLKRLNREKDELLQLSMDRGRLLQERQQQVARMEEELRTATDEQRRAELHAGRGGAEVLALQRRLREAEQTQARLQREFGAYKQHSTELLTKERALNAKLRHVIG